MQQLRKFSLGNLPKAGNGGNSSVLRWLVVLLVITFIKPRVLTNEYGVIFLMHKRFFLNVIQNVKNSPDGLGFKTADVINLEGNPSRAWKKVL